MFAKILIANRGEIARRIIRTARRMGIGTVAVYSEADHGALHVREADEAVAIGAAPAAESYLRIERIVAACRATGAEAVHPGYGFLSEKAEFAAALEAEGIAFIGPTAAAIAAMGDKIQSKRLAASAGVSTVPGHLEVIPDADGAVAVARALGYPVMLKASAGGGGKGMRIARSDTETREGFIAAGNEARSSFGDDRIFIEKYIEEPRHIEIQVLADAQGNTVHLFERECSIQRRHQKVIEEAPSPFLDDETRAAMGAQAVALAKAVRYRSAGTVEFIVDRQRNFYFLEMNTRLQVEHPVTEMITGLDLVELMIRIAAGEPLPFAQSDLGRRGWAIEARVYAEDPLRGFLPSIGRLVRYREPAGEGVRVDAGVDEGAEISIYYDPMIAKLAASGATREEATARLRTALDGFLIRGLSHNLAFLAALAASPRFAQGRLSTDFIGQEFPQGFAGAAVSEAAKEEALSAAAAVAAIRDERAFGRDAPVEWVALLGTDRHRLATERRGPAIVATLDGRDHTVETAWRPGEPVLAARIDGRPVLFQLDPDGIGWRVSRGGASLRVTVLHPRAAELLALMPEKRAPDLSRFLLSPMPGLLVSLAVVEGQDVKAGEPLAVVEAMKMENVLRAERDARIAKIRAHPRESLAVDQVILEFA